MKKTIKLGKYNAAEIIKIYDDGSILCKVIEESIDQEGLITEISHEDGISFDADHLPFELTDEELEELNTNGKEESSFASSEPGSQA